MSTTRGDSPITIAAERGHGDCLQLLVREPEGDYEERSEEQEVEDKAQGEGRGSGLNDI